MGALAKHSEPVANLALAKLQRQVDEIETKLHPIVTKMLDEGLTCGSSRDTSRVVLTGLTYAKYLRDVAANTLKVEHSDDLSEDDLVALPQADLEKVIKLGARLLGKDRLKELTG